MRPETRRNDVLTQTVGDELVIYDERSHEAHRLNPTAAAVWRAADGQRSISELSSILRRSLRAAASPSAELSQDESDEIVRIAVGELDRVGLLVRALPDVSESMTRREMIGVTAALVPVIASIMAPTPAMAQSFPFALFNGTYVGPGTPGTPNACGIGGGQTTVTLALIGVGTTAFGTMTIRHQGGTTFTVQVTSVQVVSQTQITVTGVSGVGGVGYTAINTFTFTLGANNTATVAGNQQISYPECGTTPYNVTGTRQQAS
jgi:hypothetical protein